MTHASPAHVLENGLAVIHANQLESLLEVADFWLDRFPLSPLQNEVFLVSNNGMAQWLAQQLALKSAQGVAAGLDLCLPSTFIWSVYREVLGARIPRQQLLAKAPLTWRLYRMLPQLMQQPEFADLSRFLADDMRERKRYQLAEKLADLFDQYQVYRSDWLVDWAEGRDRLLDGLGQPQPLPASQHWQARLWRAVLNDLGDTDLTVASRASVHAEFMAHVDQLQPRLPPRIIVFGISSLPQQFIEVLVKIARYSQVILFVHNPCRHYWADIIEDKTLLKVESRRFARKTDWPSDLAPEALHQYANPLLAAWGKQGRDYLRLLDQFDDLSRYRNWPWPEDRIDVFSDYGETGQRSLLQQLQQDILDLQPLPPTPLCLAPNDASVQFHIAHSRQREVEILHDQLLAWFNAGVGLQARDVIVMVPDINAYAPHIRAVFDQYDRQDPRHIPFSLADQQQRGVNPLLNALETLLGLPDSRFAVSECLGLLEVAALRKRFDIDEAVLPLIKRWIHESGIRWGLDEQQRQHTVAMPAGIQANTWEFGLQRLLLGFAVAEGDLFADIAPYPAVSGLESQHLGSLAALVQSLRHYAELLAHSYPLDYWLTLLPSLLADFFIASDDSERQTLEKLQQALLQWQDTAGLAELGDAALIPVTVVREVWLTALDQTHLQQRFLSGRVNFCTLMPMRAIPFRRICLLGLNDGEYPRSQPVPGFDLLALPGLYRQGDRSRRQDDQYLFLEAVLSARELLYISWIGHSIRDNSELPPSVLVSQFRDVIARGWQLAEAKAGSDVLAALTVKHPLQAFSRQYLSSVRDPRLFTYAWEWYRATLQTDDLPPLAPWSLPENLALEQLSAWVRAPVKYFCQHTLQINFDSDPLNDLDQEPFAWNGLEVFLQRQDLLAGLRTADSQDLERYLETAYQRLCRQGQLPLADFGRKSFAGLATELRAVWQRYQPLRQLWPHHMPNQMLQLPCGVMTLTGVLENLHQDAQQRYASLVLSGESLLDKQKQPRYHRLLNACLAHWLACACGWSLTTLIVGQDTTLYWEAVEPERAAMQLQGLLDIWQSGCQQPLPLALKTALVWLSNGEQRRREAAARCYDGSAQFAGEVAYDPYLQRFYPDFTALEQAGGWSFGECAEQCYGGIYQQMQTLKVME